MSRSPALATGSGTRTGAGLGGGGAATRLEVGGEKRLKSGKENRSTLGKENCLKSGREKPPKLGKELAVAAPMTVRAARYTAITDTWLEATFGAASGCLPPCVSLPGASVTCVPYVSAQSRDSSHRRSAKQNSHRGDKPTMARARLPARIRLKSWARMVNDRLFQRPVADVGARPSQVASELGARMGQNLDKTIGEWIRHKHTCDGDRSPSSFGH